MQVLATVCVLVTLIWPLGPGLRIYTITSDGRQTQANASDRFTAVANKIVQGINSSDYEAITRGFNQAMSAGFPLEKAKTFFDGLKNKFGKVQSLDAPRLMPPDAALFLTRFERGVMDMKIALDDQNRISALGFMKAEPAGAGPGSEARVNETRMRFPFKGRWLVMNGGDTREMNAHHDAPNQVFAFDFVGVDADGKVSAGDGKRVEDYFCFGREVVAPAAGVVTIAIQGVPDNEIGSLNPYSALGNAVFIEHQKGEVSVLAHLKLGSTRVKAGDRVQTGDVIGLCGNSGNSTTPHLHYHLQDSSVIQDGKGIKVYFEKFEAGRGGAGVLVERYSPIKGEIVSLF
jgi:hypothetical protein